MNVDIGNSLSTVASPGVSEDALESLDDDVARAHETIASERASGTFGYVSLALPDRTDRSAIEALTDRFDDVEAVLTVGIGGSALGAKAVTDALNLPAHYVLDNVDPAHVSSMLESVDLEKSVVHVISRSGQTVETLANFLAVREAMNAVGVDWRERTVVTTGKSGPLRNITTEHDLPTFDVPAGVPGRFSVLSPVGLVAPVLLGGDIGGILEGAKTASDRLAPSLWECPAYAYGATSVALERRGVTTNVMMPYAESLETFAEWFAQLWAESLGKNGLGQTPVRALGVTDQHSQLQLYRDGRREILVSLLRPRNRSSHPLPETDVDDLSHVSGGSLEAIMDAEFRATEASLAQNGRPTVRLEIDRIDPRSLGNLLYSMEAACILAGELQGIDVFDQPAVEWGKNAARDLLQGADTDATRAIESKTSLSID